MVKVAVKEMRYRLRLCWYQSTTVERGKDIWRNNGLEGATGSNKSDAIEPSAIEVLVDGWIEGQ